jgi:hypothetical protein
MAYKLRDEILNMETTKMPQKCTLDSVKQGECQIPQLLLDFITSLIFGPKPKCVNNISKQGRVEVICNDIIYTLTNGRTKPAKNILLGKFASLTVVSLRVEQ